MEINFFTGASGSGKSKLLYETLIREAADGLSKRLFLVVPEQYTMMTQKNIVKVHPGHGTFNIDIVSFNRLAYRVFEELGISLLTVIDDTGKNLILRKVIDDNRDKLKIIKVKDSQGFVSEIKSIISELLQYSVTFSMLENAKELIRVKGINNNERLKCKIEDILTIYRAFLEYIDQKYITTEEITEILCKCVGRSRLLNDSIVAFDGFTGFTPVQFNLIELLFDKAKSMYFTVTLPQNADEQLFFMSYDMIKKISDRADKNGILTKRVQIDKNMVPYRFANNAQLAHLERELFRRQSVYDGDVDNLLVYQAFGKKAEIEFVAAKIKEYVAQGIRYRQIGVIACDMEEYKETISNIFELNKIPCFMDNKRSILANPAVEYIRAALNVIAKDYSYESVFRFLKAYMCPIKGDEIDILENYVLALGIRGHKKWSQPFIRKMPTQNALYRDLDMLNGVRKSIFELLEPLYNVFHDGEKTVDECIEVLEEFVIACNVGENLAGLKEEMILKLKFSLAKEYEQSYEDIIYLFEQMKSLLSGEKIKIKQFMDILDAGFNEIKIGIIPPTIDMVSVGDLERTRLDEVKVLFFVGVNEGEVPKTESNKGILSELERELLSQAEIELAPTVRQKAFMQNFYLYLMFTKPSDKLIFTLNKEISPSKLLFQLRKMYPKMKVLSDDSVNKCELIYNPTEGMQHIFELIGLGEELSDEDKALFRAVLKNDEYFKKIEKFRKLGIQMVCDDDILAVTAKLLYGEVLVGSVSRMEAYASCAFMHFAKYGLRLEERRLYELGANDLGTLFHETLKIYSVRLAREKKTYATITDNERVEYVREAIEIALTDYNNSIFNDSNRNEYLKERIEKIMLRTVYTLGEQIKAGSFVPTDFEKTFYFKNKDIEITGKIDRIDYAVKEDKSYVKIIDYKSGKKTIDIGKLYDGLQLQLMIYLENFLEENIPSAAMYYHIDNPIVEVDLQASEADIKNELLSALRPQGIVNSEVSSLELLDHVTTHGKSVFIPVSYNKDSSLSKTSQATTEERLRMLGKYAIKKMGELGEEINSGKTKANPYPDSCAYCPYAAICGFGNEDANRSYRKPSKLGNDDESFRIIAERIKD